jgi:predicted TIM-barrel fold metal-dependent hydrolase
MSTPTPDVDQIREQSHKMFADELDAFVPDRVFDAHFEMWDAAEQDHFKRSVGVTLPTRFADVQPACDWLHPGRQVGAAFIPFSFKPELVASINEWSSQQARASGGTCCTYFFATPEDDPEWVRQEVRRLGAIGLKSYHTYAAEKPTWEVDIPQYMPEPLVKVAHEEGWVINMHLVKKGAVGDPSNIRWIRHYCTSYPDMTLVLSHSARGFQPENNLRGLPQLSDLDNLYFDTSVNCEAFAHETIIQIMGHERLLYGSDYPCCHELGRYIALGDSFAVIDGDNPVFESKVGTVTPALVGLEHLRSLKWACWSQKLTDSQVEDVFWNNAQRVFGPFS